MGRLVAKAYATQMVYNLADHTYVECGTRAKGWGCWGGKSGGRTIGYGAGSTLRADAIAQPDERAGITCYAINGVCHQAANRILLPAGGEVTAARGYGLSVALYGVYGRPIGPFGGCPAPLQSHSTISGDLNECLQSGPPDTPLEQDKEVTEPHRAMLQSMLDLYEQPELTQSSSASRIEFQLVQFKIFAMHRLEKHAIALRNLKNLAQVQQNFEIIRTALEDQLAQQKVDRQNFAEGLNEMTKSYQSEIAKILPEDAYIALLDCKPGEELILCDPRLFVSQPEPPRNPRPFR